MCKSQTEFGSILRFNRNSEFKSITYAVHVSMMEAEEKSKNASILRNLADCKPILDNETQESGSVQMLKRFNTTKSDILTASTHDASDLLVDLAFSIERSSRI